MVFRSRGKANCQVLTVTREAHSSTQNISKCLYSLHSTTVFISWFFGTIWISCWWRVQLTAHTLKLIKHAAHDSHCSDYNSSETLITGHRHQVPVPCHVPGHVIPRFVWFRSPHMTCQGIRTCLSGRCLITSKLSASSLGTVWFYVYCFFVWSENRLSGFSAWQHVYCWNKINDECSLFLFVSFIFFVISKF